MRKAEWNSVTMETKQYLRPIKHHELLLNNAKQHPPINWQKYAQQQQLLAILQAIRI